MYWGLILRHRFFQLIAGGLQPAPDGDRSSEGAIALASGLKTSARLGPQGHDLSAHLRKRACLAGVVASVVWADWRWFLAPGGTNDTAFERPPNWLTPGASFGRAAPSTTLAREPKPMAHLTLSRRRPETCCREVLSLQVFCIADSPQPRFYWLNNIARTCDRRATLAYDLGSAQQNAAAAVPDRPRGERIGA